MNYEKFREMTTDAVYHIEVAYIDNEETALLFDRFVKQYTDVVDFRYSDDDNYGELVRVSLFGDSGYLIGISNLIQHSSVVNKVYQNDDDVAIFEHIVNHATVGGADYIEYYVPKQKEEKWKLM